MITTEPQSLLRQALLMSSSGALPSIKTWFGFLLAFAYHGKEGYCV